MLDSPAQLLDDLTPDAHAAWTARCVPDDGLTFDELHAHLSAVVRSLRTHRTGLCLHGAAVELAHGSVFISGTTGSGKSTLALSLAVGRAGRLVSDDTVWLRDRLASGVNAPVSIRRSGPWFAAVTAVALDDGSSRVLIRPEQLGAPSGIGECTVSLIVVPDFRAGPPELEPLGPATAFCHLVSASLVDLSTDDMYELAKFASSVPAVVARYGSIEDSLDLVDAALELTGSAHAPVVVPRGQLDRAGFVEGARAIDFGDSAVVWREGFPSLAVVDRWDVESLDASPAWPALEDLGFTVRVAT